MNDHYSGLGVHGESTAGIGVFGRTNDGIAGVRGQSLGHGDGVQGESWGANNSGVSGINTAAGGYGVFGQTPTSGNGAAIYGHAGNSSTSYAGYFYGQVRAFSYSTASDARLKKDIKNLTYGLREVSLLRPVTYTWKDESSSQRRQLGLIAQEVEQVFPELVQGDRTGTLSVNYQALIPVVIKAINEQQAIIKKQEARIAAIESQKTMAYSSMYGLALGLLPLGLLAAWRGRRDVAVRRT